MPQVQGHWPIWVIYCWVRPVNAAGGAKEWSMPSQKAQPVPSVLQLRVKSRAACSARCSGENGV